MMCSFIEEREGAFYVSCQFTRSDEYLGTICSTIFNQRKDHALSCRLITSKLMIFSRRTLLNTCSCSKVGCGPNASDDSRAGCAARLDV